MMLSSVSQLTFLITISVSLSSTTKVYEVSLVENEFLLRLNDSFAVVRSERGYFTAPLLSKINVSQISNATCYHHPLWNKTLLPVTVDLWTTQYLQNMAKALEDRKSKLCDLVNGDMEAQNLCGTNVTLLPKKAGKFALESDFRSFEAAPVDFSYRRYAPSSITFSVAVPSSSNCSSYKQLFQERSFVSLIHLTMTNNDLRDTEMNDRNSTVDIWLTNKAIFEAVGASNDSNGKLNMSTVKYVREDQVAMLSIRLSSLLLRNVSSNYANAEKIRDLSYRFLCPKSISVTDTMKDVNQKQEAFPDTTSTLLNGMSGLRYCRVPQIEWTVTYREGRQYHDHRYGYRYEYYESPNIKNYLKITLHRSMVYQRVQLPLSPW